MDLPTCGRKRRSRPATNARRELEPNVENLNKTATFNQPVTTMATHPILKQFEDLSAADFAAWPVWIPCRPGDSAQPWYPQTDNNTYRPWTDALPVGRDMRSFLAQSALTLADGTVFEGFAACPAHGANFDISTVQPQLFTIMGRRFGFWFGNSSPSTFAKHDFYTAMGKPADAIFPIINAVSPEISAVDLTISIPGFLHFDTAPPPGFVVET